MTLKVKRDKEGKIINMDEIMEVFVRYNASVKGKGDEI